ncbi:hypothetical protein C0W54_09260 [Photobacterium kishitanii]|nr:hypothetical protein C0W54_09260 [Photobacterium kishitanii]
MIRRWLYFIVHSVLIITVLTNAAYAHTTKITPTSASHCSSMESSCCCENTTTVINPLTANCNDDCNGNDCSSKHHHQLALLSSFSFQSFRSTEVLMNTLCQPPRYYHEPLLKPPMA